MLQRTLLHILHHQLNRRNMFSSALKLTECKSHLFAAAHAIEELLLSEGNPVIQQRKLEVAISSAREAVYVLERCEYYVSKAEQQHRQDAEALRNYRVLFK